MGASCQLARFPGMQDRGLHSIPASCSQQCPAITMKAGPSPGAAGPRYPTTCFSHETTQGSSSHEQKILGPGRVRGWILAPSTIVTPQSSGPVCSASVCSARKAATRHYRLGSRRQCQGHDPWTGHKAVHPETSATWNGHQGEVKGKGKQVESPHFPLVPCALSCAHRRASCPVCGIGTWVSPELEPLERAGTQGVNGAGSQDAVGSLLQGADPAPPQPAAPCPRRRGKGQEMKHSSFIYSPSLGPCPPHPTPRTPGAPCPSQSIPGPSCWGN